MASSHVHSVREENGFHHLFNLMFMTVPEIETIGLALSAKPIPVDKIDILNNLKEHIRKMHDAAITKDAELHREEINSIGKDEGEVREVREVDAEVIPPKKPVKKPKKPKKPKKDGDEEQPA